MQPPPFPIPYSANPYASTAPDPAAQQIATRFRAFDRAGKGSIDAGDLCAALSPNPSEPLPYVTARMLIRLFSTTGVITAEGFPSLCAFLDSVQATFQALDGDGCGALEPSAVTEHLARELPDVGEAARQILVRTFKRFGSRDVSAPDFLALMAYVTLARKLFAGWDAEQTGVVAFDIENMLLAHLWFI